MLDFSVTLAITIINIVILYFLLRALLFKPVTKFMADRAKRVQDSIDKAEDEKAKAGKLLAECQSKLKNADIEAETIINRARENADREAKRIIANGKAEAAEITANARRQFETERQAALAKFNIEAAAMVVAASARLAQREMTGDDNRRFANLLLDELAARKRNA